MRRRVASHSAHQNSNMNHASFFFNRKSFPIGAHLWSAGSKQLKVVLILIDEDKIISPPMKLKVFPGCFFNRACLCTITELFQLSLTGVSIIRPSGKTDLFIVPPHEALLGNDVI